MRTYRGVADTASAQLQCGCPQRHGSCAYNEEQAKDAGQMAVVERDITSESEAAEALRQLSEADLRRLEALARMRAIGLAEVDWRDLLQEAVCRLLDGSRHWPRDVPLLAFLHQTMRSIASDHWRRREEATVVPEADLSRDECDERTGIVEGAPDGTTSPERESSAAETLARIEALFADDPDAQKVISGMASGKGPREIQEEAEMHKKRYATTQRRIRRTLARAFPERRGPA